MSSNPSHIISSKSTPKMFRASWHEGNMVRKSLLSKKRLLFKSDKEYNMTYKKLESGYFSDSTRVQSKPMTQRQNRKSDNGHPVYPNWLLTRPDFIQTCKSFQEQLERELDRVVKLHYNQRSECDKQVLFKWVSSVKFFSELPETMIKDACDKLVYQSYEQGETLLQMGEQANSMLIIYTGLVGIYIDNKQINLQGPKTTLGERSLHVDMLRSATCIAETPVQTFQFRKNDYENILLTIKKLEKQSNTTFLKTIKYFESWSYLKVQRLSALLTVKEYSQGDLIYEKDCDSTFLYILRHGNVDIQTYVEVTQNNRWPTGHKQWLSLIHI